MVNVFDTVLQRISVFLLMVIQSKTLKSLASTTFPGISEEHQSVTLVSCGCNRWALISVMVVFSDSRTLPLIIIQLSLPKLLNNPASGPPRRTHASPPPPHPWHSQSPTLKDHNK